MNRSFHFDNRGNGDDNGQHSSPWNQGDQGFRGFQGRRGFRQSFPYARQQFSNSPHNQNHRGRNNQSFSGRRDISINDYFHPSMLEDPWAELLEHYRNQEEKSTKHLAEKEKQSEEAETKPDC